MPVLSSRARYSRPSTSTFLRATTARSMGTCTTVSFITPIIMPVLPESAACAAWCANMTQNTESCATVGALRIVYDGSMYLTAGKMLASNYYMSKSIPVCSIFLDFKYSSILLFSHTPTSRNFTLPLASMPALPKCWPAPSDTTIRMCPLQRSVSAFSYYNSCKLRRTALSIVVRCFLRLFQWRTELRGSATSWRRCWPRTRAKQ